MSKTLVSIESKNPSQERAIRCLESLYNSTSRSFDLLLHSKTWKEFNYAKSHNDPIKEVLDDYEYFLITSDDLVFESDWLTHALRSMKKYPECGLVGAKILYPDKKLNHIGAGIIQSRTNSFHIGQNKNPSNFNESSFVPAVTGAFHFLRKEAFKEVGMYSEEFIRTEEDIDICLRLWLNDWKIRVNADIILIHHVSSTVGEKPDIARRKFICKWEDKISEVKKKMEGEKIKYSVWR